MRETIENQTGLHKEWVTYFFCFYLLILEFDNWCCLFSNVYKVKGNRGKRSSVNIEHSLQRILGEKIKSHENTCHRTSES